MLVLLGVGFVAGALVVLVLEAVVLLVLIHRINRRVAQQQQKANEGKAPESSPIHYDPSFHDKQAILLILPALLSTAFFLPFSFQFVLFYD